MQAGFSFLCLPHKRIDNSLLIAGHEIQSNLRNFSAGAARLDSAQLYVAQCRGFESAETEVEAAVADFRNGKRKAARIPVLRQPVNQRPAGITQTQEFGQLIQGFSRSIVPRSPNGLILARFRRKDERRVSAGNNQRQQRIFNIGIFYECGEDMSFEYG